MVRPLDPPDRIAHVAAVVALRDRPERVVLPDGHHLLRAVRLGRARDGAPDENGEPCDEKHPDEHVFAMLANKCSSCQGPLEAPAARAAAATLRTRPFPIPTSAAAGPLPGTKYAASPVGHSPAVSDSS